MCGRVGHAPATAGRTQPPPLARKRDQSVVATGIAVNPQEPFGQNPAGEIGTQLPLDEVGGGGAPLAGAREKAFEIFSNDVV
jgi:hypothetical protein